MKLYSFFSKRSLPYYLSVILFGILIFHIVSSCSDDDNDPVDPIINEDLNSYVKTLQELNQPSPEPYTLSDVETVEVDNYVCQKEVYTGNPGFNEMLFSRTNLDVLYPGALLNGQSVNDGSYTLCNLARAPMTLTVNLQSLSGNIFKTIEKPSYSSIQSSIHEILSQEIVGDAGAEMNWSIEKISNEAHLKVELGVNCELKNVFKVGSDLQFGSGIKHQRVIAQYAQKYYDIIIDQPTKPCDFLDITNTSVDAVKNEMGSRSPMYISSVSYGRYALFYFESLDLETNLKSEVEASLPILVDGGNINVGAKRKLEALMSSGYVNCKAYILGGSGEDASQSLLNPDQFITFIQNGGKYSKDSPGKPISFTLRYLCNNKPVKIIKTTQYEEVTCSKASNKYRITLKSIKFISGGAEIALKGPINVNYGGPGNPTGGGNLFNESWFSIWLGISKDINKSVDVEFGTLTSEERQNAYIELDWKDLNCHSAFIPAKFTPDSEKIYLNELVEQDDLTISILSKHLIGQRVELTFSVEILD